MTACRLHLLHSGHVIDATIQAVRAERVVLHVSSRQRDEMLQPEALCCVAFPFRQSLYAFVGCVNKVRDGEAVLEVHFDIPATLAATNLRRSFRVPVVRDAGVELTLLLGDGTRIDAEAVNISESGVEANLPPDDNRLAIDDVVQCELRFRDQCIALPAVVRRRQLSHRALQFTPSRTPDARQQIAALQRVVRVIEQIWLKSRLA